MNKGEYKFKSIIQLFQSNAEGANVLAQLALDLPWSRNHNGFSLLHIAFQEKEEKKMLRLTF